MQHGRTFSYNAAGWKVSQTDALNRQTTYTHDKAGRTKTVADPRPVTVTYTYDKADRLVSTTATGLTTINMAYDAAGRRTSLQDGTGTATYTYNGLDNLTVAAHSTNGTVTYEYDLLGRRTAVKTSTRTRYAGYTYDAVGRLLEVQNRSGTTDPDELVASATYDAAGRLEQVERANGIDTDYSYDGANRLTALSHKLGNTEVDNFSYTLNRAGQVTSASETLDQASRSIGYTYDGLGRLTVASEQPGAVYTYTFDLVGNRTSAIKDGTTVESRTYDAADQVTNTGWQYDGAGNLLADGTNTYTYDALRRLSSVTKNGTSTQYGYNGDSVLSTESIGSNATHYLLDTTAGLPERLEEITSSGNAWYIRGWGKELLRTSGAGEVWYLSDRLGSVRSTLTDAGVVLSSYNYDPFGTPEGTSQPANYGFTGEPQSTSTGLVHMRARWYNTSSGSFANHDFYFGELDSPQGLHRYGYAYNDPVNSTDPTGLTPDRYSDSGQPREPKWDEVRRSSPGLNQWGYSFHYRRFYKDPDMPALPAIAWWGTSSNPRYTEDKIYEYDYRCVTPQTAMYGLDKLIGCVANYYPPMSDSPIIGLDAGMVNRPLGQSGKANSADGAGSNTPSPKPKHEQGESCLTHPSSKPHSNSRSEGGGSIKKFGANDLVYGPSAGGKLREWRNKRGGGKLLQDERYPYESGMSWTDFSIRTMDRAVLTGRLIHFDLTHMDVPGALTRTGPYRDTVTSHELRHIRDHWNRFQTVVKFYRNDQEVSPPWIK